MATAFDSATGYAAYDGNASESTYSGTLVTTPPTVADLVGRLWPTVS